MRYLDFDYSRCFCNCDYCNKEKIIYCDYNNDFDRRELPEIILELRESNWITVKVPHSMDLLDFCSKECYKNYLSKIKEDKWKNQENLIKKR